MVLVGFPHTLSPGRSSLGAGRLGGAAGGLRTPMGALCAAAAAVQQRQYQVGAAALAAGTTAVTFAMRVGTTAVPLPLHSTSFIPFLLPNARTVCSHACLSLLAPLFCACVSPLGQPSITQRSLHGMGR